VAVMTKNQYLAAQQARIDGIKNELRSARWMIRQGYTRWDNKPDGQLISEKVEALNRSLRYRTDLLQQMKR
jgi:hypothetical protein